MALKIVITVSKKIPGPQEYSSIQSSCSLEGELAAGQDPVVEATRLQTQAQTAVDHFLGLAAVAPQRSPNTSAAVTSSASPPSTTTSIATATSRPYPSNRRAPALITDSQTRYLSKLISDTRTDPNSILHQHQINDLRQLTCKAAAGLIDELKSVGSPR